MIARMHQVPSSLAEPDAHEDRGALQYMSINVNDSEAVRTLQSDDEDPSSLAEPRVHKDRFADQTRVDIQRIVSATKVGQRYRVWIDAHPAQSEASTGDVKSISMWLWSDDASLEVLDTSLSTQLSAAVFKADANDAVDSAVDDMPALSDARRVIRIAMMVDEVRQICKAHATLGMHKIRDHISPDEFFACGGRKQDGKSYSLYRQLVYAKRDVDAYSSRMCFPTGKAVKSAIETYEFYPSDDEKIDSLDHPSSKASLPPPLASSPVLGPDAL